MEIIKELRRGIRTSEFKVLLAAVTAVVTGVAPVATLIAPGAYIVSRFLAKSRSVKEVMDISNLGVDLPVKEVKKLDSYKYIRGSRTSEFFVAILAAVLPVIDKHFNLGLPVAELVGCIGVMAGYIIQRGWLKK
jgi:hypothetical protein